LNKNPAPIAPMGFVVLSFMVSRLLYLCAGLLFDLTPPRYFYQFIDPELLRNRLFESLWYLHGQPPLFNLFTGLLYQWFSPQSRIYQVLFFALGLAFSLVLYWLGLRLGLRRWVSASLAAWFMASPATVLYENLFFYTYPVVFILVLSVVALSKFLETKNFWWGLSFFGLLASLCLTWAIFHLAWMLVVIVLIGIYDRNWRRLVLISLVPVLLVAGWYAKNYILFGSFGASSWAGLNLSHVTFLSPSTPESVRNELVDQGEIAPYPVVEAFRSVEHYQGFMPVPPLRGIPILDAPLKSTDAVNFNHSFYIDLSDRMLRDALDFIQARPDLYLSSVKQGFSIYFHSSSDYLLLKDKPAPQLEIWWDRIFYGQLRPYGEDLTDRWESDPRTVGWWLVVMYVAGILYGVKLILAPNKSSMAFLAVIAFMTFTILYFTVMANFIDLGENNRFRFALDPLVLLLFGKWIQDLTFGRRSRGQPVLSEDRPD
jgi:hypothetical protein